MRYEFGNFCLDGTRRLLLNRVDGAPIPLASKVVDTLLYLIEHRAAIVEKTELMSAVWPNVVVEENNLNQIISVLRKTLGEVPGENRFVVTHPGRGYRFVADIKTVTHAESNATPDVSAAQPARKTIGALALIVSILLGTMVVGIWMWRGADIKREQRTEALTEIASLLSKDQYSAAFARARTLVDDEPGQDDQFRKLWEQIVLPMRPLVTEAGATVHFKSYSDVDGEWIKAGVSPFSKPVDAPRGVLRLKVEKPGFRTAYFVITNPGPSLDSDSSGAGVASLPTSKTPLPLVAANTLSDEWVYVPGTTMPAALPGWATSTPGRLQYEIPPFAIARSEVTNREFKEFIDAGGYDNELYWRDMSFQEDGKILPWAEARRRFVDATNRPGPAEWQLSTYPTGHALLPVGGISWYEAMAYARFRGQTLPTLHHWVRAAVASFDGSFNSGPAIASASRFSANGPAPAHDVTGLGPWGTVNMFGNVREWVWNFTHDNTSKQNALALGGAWNDYAGMYQNSYTTQPMQRLPHFGMRLMQPLAGAAISKELLQPLQLAYDDPDNPNLKREPVSDEAFAAMRFQFTTTHAQPLSQSAQVIKETELWQAEEVILTFPNSETTTLYIVRPRAQRGRLQPIVFGPPSDCCLIKRPNREVLDQMHLAGFVVSSGRALVLPIWAGSYERKVPTALDPKAIGDLQRRAAARWHQDISATMDYLASREDIDARNAGFFGFSFGANNLAPIALAIDERFKAAVLASGGIVLTSPPHPMIDIINYAPRITVPVLMLNGRFDPLFPLKQSQQRLFNLLGTPAKQKSHIVYDVGHLEFPANTLARDTSNWFDQFLGEVR